MKQHDPVTQLIALSQLPREIQRRGGKCVSRSTVYRWVHRGVKGRCLRTLAIGGIEYTTWEWLIEMGTKPTHTPQVEDSGRNFEKCVEELIREGM